MVGKYKVITLCGSTRFKDAFSYREPPIKAHSH